LPKKKAPAFLARSLIYLSRVKIHFLNNIIHHGLALGMIGMPNGHPAIGHERLKPVAAGRSDGQQALADEPLAAVPANAVQALV
jgi:hypothetical protein